MRRAPLLFASGLALLLATLGSAKAEPPFCDSLRAQLATLPSEGPSPPSRSFGCSGGFFARLLSGCGPMAQSFGQTFGFGDRQRTDILQAMARWGCSGSGGGGTVRTVCVRTCDGYYFPISNSANRKRLKVDEAVCHAMYPGGGAELYTQRYGGDTEADMKSLSGDTYSSQPFAYRYRTVYDPSCAGELQRRPSSPAIAATPIPMLPDPTSATTGADANTFEAPEERATRIVGPADFYTLPDASEPTVVRPPARAQLFSRVPRFATASVPLASQ